jgi:hypothetical protein
MIYFCGLSNECPASCVYAEEDPDNNHFIICADVGIVVEACPYQEASQTCKEREPIAIKNCPWCDKDGWYYPTGDGQPERIRCGHE